ncbi:MAG TPA: hypothetical protein VGT61_12110 [Thermomicrobiales bacterium]|nr:hypothetical protein [Thermomicrobiales bacterium]
MATGTPDGVVLGRGIRMLLDDPARFSDVVLPERALRGYQRGPARAIARSIRDGRGEQHVLVFSRQAGKDEVLAQLLAWVLVRYHRRGGNAVMACPSFTPQGTLARDRLLDRLRATVPAGLVE